MKTIVLCLSAIVILAAGCSKSGTTTTGRDAFVGNYAMHDTTVNVVTFNGTTYTYDTIYQAYTMVVLAQSGTSDRVVFNNVGNTGVSDTGIVSSNVVSFVNNASAAATATLTNGRIVLAGGVLYTTSTYSRPYATAVGTKQ